MESSLKPKPAKEEREGAYLIYLFATRLIFKEASQNYSELLFWKIFVLGLCILYSNFAGLYS